MQATASEVTVDITNTGKVAGAEVAQLYLGYPKEAGEPPKCLRGFSKVLLAVGEKKTVTFPLDDQSSSVWNTVTHDWMKVPGTFTAYVGSSSRDIRLTATIKM